MIRNFLTRVLGAYPFPPETGASGPAATSRVAVVVDDDSTLKRAIGRLLSKNGFSVHYAEDGREALDLLKGIEGGISVLVTDHDMPRMTGSELMRAVRDKNLTVGVMVGLSANPANQIEFLAAGADLVFNKPFDFANICSKILETLHVV